METTIDARDHPVEQLAQVAPSTNHGSRPDDSVRRAIRMRNALTLVTEQIDLHERDQDRGMRNAWVAVVFAVSFGGLQAAEAWYLPGTRQYLSSVVVVDVVGAFVLTPLVVALFLALPDVARRLLRRLREDGVVEVASAKDLDAVAPGLGWLNHRRLVVPAAVLAGLYLPYTLVNGRKDVDDFLGGVLVFVTAAFQTVLVFIGVVAVFRLGIVAHGIGQLLRGLPVHVQPLHPDRCGGLWIVGRLFTLMFNVATVFGIAAVCFALIWINTPLFMLRRPELYLLAAFYIGLLPLAFLNLLWRPHELLEAHRTTLLKPLGHVFNHAVMVAAPQETDDVNQLQSKGDLVAEIARQRQMLDELCPVWPLRIWRLRTVLVTAVLPVVFALVSPLFAMSRAAFG
jgi:hypothetical protein